MGKADNDRGTRFFLKKGAEENKLQYWKIIVFIVWMALLLVYIAYSLFNQTEPLTIQISPDELNQVQAAAQTIVGNVMNKIKVGV